MENSSGEEVIAKTFIIVLVAIGAYFLVDLVIAPAVKQVSDIYSQWQAFLRFIHSLTHPFGLYITLFSIIGITHDNEFDNDIKVAQDLMEGKRPSFSQFMSFFGIILAVEFLLDLIGIPLDGFFLPIEGVFDLITVAMFLFGSD